MQRSGRGEWDLSVTDRVLGDHVDAGSPCIAELSIGIDRLVLCVPGVARLSLGISRLSFFAQGVGGLNLGMGGIGLCVPGVAGVVIGSGQSVVDNFEGDLLRCGLGLERRFEGLCYGLSGAVVVSVEAAPLWRRIEQRAGLVISSVFTGAVPTGGRAEDPCRLVWFCGNRLSMGVIACPFVSRGVIRVAFKDVGEQAETIIVQLCVPGSPYRVIPYGPAFGGRFDADRDNALFAGIFVILGGE